MPTHPRTHADDARIVAKLLKEGAEPRQAASVKKAREKGTRKKSTRSPARRDSLSLLLPIILAFIGILWFLNGPSAHSELETLLVLFRP